METSMECFGCLSSETYLSYRRLRDCERTFPATVPRLGGFNWKISQWRTVNSYPTEVFRQRLDNASSFAPDIQRWRAYQVFGMHHPDPVEMLSRNRKQSSDVFLEQIESINCDLKDTASSKSSDEPSRRRRQVQRRQQLGFDRWQQERLEQSFLSCHYPCQTSRHQLSLELLTDEVRIQTWFQNRRAKWRKMDGTRKRPGRPSSKRPPTNCSGVPIPTEELGRRQRMRAEKRTNYSSTPLPCLNSAPSTVRETTEEGTYPETNVTPKEEMGLTIDGVTGKLESTHAVCPYDLDLLKSSREETRSRGYEVGDCGYNRDSCLIGERVQLFGNDNVTTDGSKAFDSESNDFVSASETFHPAHLRPIIGQQTKLTFGIDSILGRTVYV